MLQSCYQKHLRTHALTPKHAKKLEHFNSGRTQNIALKIFIHDHQVKNRMEGSSLPGHTKLFRLKLVPMMARANMSTRSMEDIKQDIEMWAEQTGGCRRQLNSYWAIHHRLWEEHLKKFITSCMFNQFGIIVDGTPSFAPAEGFKLRAVSKEWDIVEVLLRVTLLANVIITSIQYNIRQYDSIVHVCILAYH